MTLLILGLMFGYTANSFISILMHFTLAERFRHTIWFWIIWWKHDQ